MLFLKRFVGIKNADLFQTNTKMLIDILIFRYLFNWVSINRNSAYISP